VHQNWYIVLVLHTKAGIILCFGYFHDCNCFLLIKELAGNVYNNFSYNFARISIKSIFPRGGIEFQNAVWWYPFSCFYHNALTLSEIPLEKNLSTMLGLGALQTKQVTVSCPPARGKRSVSYFLVHILLTMLKFTKCLRKISPYMEIILSATLWYWIRQRQL
jgi:hypothetical protein